MNDEINRKIATLEQKIQSLEAERASLLQQINQLKALKTHSTPSPVTQYSSNAEKIRLFRSLFRGREDVYPKRWENSKTGKSGYSPVCGNEWKSGLCEKPRIKCGECSHRSFLPVTDQVIQNHLSGNDPNKNHAADFVIGLYPMLTDEHCWFIAVDFDKANWQDDAKAFSKQCIQQQVPYAIEISRSEQGAHLWIFFDRPVFAVEARKLGALLLTQAMNDHPEMGFESCDRFFPIRIPCQKADSVI